MIRVLIVGDSLACPRDEVNVENTWAEHIMREFGLYLDQQIVFYNKCKQGMHSNCLDWNAIRLLNPDIIICQIGVVDASRRALGGAEVTLLTMFGGTIGKKIHSFVNRHHYAITKRRNKHYAYLEQYYANMVHLLDYAKEVAYITIAAPGESLKLKTYHIEEDVAHYNQVLEEIGKDCNRAFVLNPYDGILDMNEILLEDGHHINLVGNNLVYDKVKTYLEGAVHRLY